jgi:hypothetical protein
MTLSVLVAEDEPVLILRISPSTVITHAKGEAVHEASQLGLL